MKMENYAEIALNKLIILYSLSITKGYISKNRIIYTLLDCSLMNYFTLLETFDDLLEDKMINIRDNGTDKDIQISEKGSKTASHFFSSIPKGIRKRINDELSVALEKETLKTMVIAESNEIDIDVFESRLILRERNADLINLKILAGSKQEAERICDKFKDAHEEAYRYIISYFLK